MSASDGASTTRFDELKPGDRITVQQTVTIGQKRQTVTTTGKVIRTERVRHGSRCQCTLDDETISDMILLEMPDGELTTVTMDELTVLHRA